MRTKIIDTNAVNITMDVNIDDSRECIEVVVGVHDKRKNAFETKTFPASDYPQALAYFREKEKEHK